MTSATAPAWTVLGALAPTELTASRLELHWAAQVIGAAADAWVSTRPDDSHTSMMWDPMRRALVGVAVPAGVAIALRPADLTLIALRGDDVLATFALRGQTLADALAWADQQLASASEMPIRALQPRAYDMPDHPVSSERARFAADPGALAELARWYANGALALAELAAADPRATPLRVWPHHFDLGAIIFLEAPGEREPQIGIGLSPGDGYHAEPYFYVTPHPLQQPTVWPALAGSGEWQTEGFTGAVLTGTALLDGASDPGTQHARARAFLDSAVDGARGLIGVAAR